MNTPDTRSLHQGAVLLLTEIPKSSFNLFIKLKLRWDGDNNLFSSKKKSTDFSWTESNIFEMLEYITCFTNGYNWFKKLIYEYYTSMQRNYELNLF